MAQYNVTTTYGGTKQPGGTWTIGNPTNTVSIISIDVKSPDSGKTLTGTLQHEGQGKLGIQGSFKSTHEVFTKASWDGKTGNGSTWVLGNPTNSQKVISIDASSSDNGQTLTGTCQHEGSGVLGFTASLIA